ncbi:hypothetical protein Tco_0232246 [Tanacetum coccineum]
MFSESQFDSGSQIFYSNFKSLPSGGNVDAGDIPSLSDLGINHTANMTQVLTISELDNLVALKKITKGEESTLRTQEVHREPYIVIDHVLVFTKGEDGATMPLVALLVKVPAGRYVVPTGKDNVIVSAGRSKVIPAGRTILVLVVLCLLRDNSIVS